MIFRNRERINDFIAGVRLAVVESCISQACSQQKSHNVSLHSRTEVFEKCLKETVLWRLMFIGVL